MVMAVVMMVVMMVVVLMVVVMMVTMPTLVQMMKDRKSLSRAICFLLHYV